MKVTDATFAEDVQTSAMQLRGFLLAREGEKITVAGENEKSPDLVIAPALIALLRDVLAYLEKGEGVAVVPSSMCLTTQQAADILNVSRSFLIKLLEEGGLSFAKTGRHRRIAIKELLAYKRQRDAERDSAIDEIIGIDQEVY